MHADSRDSCAAHLILLVNTYRKLLGVRIGPYVNKFLVRFPAILYNYFIIIFLKSTFF